MRLALSLEPFGRALALPEVEKLLTPELWPSKVILSVGMNPDKEVIGGTLRGERFKRWVGAVILFPINVVRRFVLRAPMRNFLVSRLLVIVNSIGTGIGAREFKSANIAVRDGLGDEYGFFRVTRLDMEKHLASLSILREVEARRGNFEYLWDDKILDKRIAVSYLWPKIAAQLPALRDAYRGTALESMVSDVKKLQKVCLTVEERARALSGVAEMLHSAYYSDDKIVRCIAQFLESGRIGEGAEASSR
jgi:hypothetical protein